MIMPKYTLIICFFAMTSFGVGCKSVSTDNHDNYHQMLVSLSALGERNADVNDFVNKLISFGFAAYIFDGNSFVTSYSFQSTHGVNITLWNTHGIGVEWFEFDGLISGDSVYLIFARSWDQEEMDSLPSNAMVFEYGKNISATGIPLKSLFE